MIWWTLALLDARVEDISDLGLVTAIPRHAFGALVLLVIAFVTDLRRGARSAAMTAHVVASIWMLFGAAPLIEGTLRLEASWRHLGIVEHIATTENVDRNIDAYFNWPGFFELMVLLQRLTGLSDLRVLAQWAPVFFNLMYIAPLHMMMRSATNDRRLIWLGIWFFFLTNWVAQDYFAPQAMGMFFYIVVLGVLLRWFAPGRGGWGWVARKLAPREDEADPDELAGTQRAALIAIVVVAFAAMVSVHQLSPFAAILGTGALVFAAGHRPRLLPLLMGVMAVGWAFFLAEPFLSGRLPEMVASFLSLTEAASQNVNSRLKGSVEHTVVIYLRLLATAALFGLAFLGMLRVRKHARAFAPIAILAGAPFALILMQPYGGEMILRVYLFALPFAALLAAALFLPRPVRVMSMRSAMVISVVCLVLIGMLFLTRHGNERAESYTREDIAAAEFLYRVAPEGSLIIAAERNLPWKFVDYADNRYRLVLELRPSEQQDHDPTLQDVIDITNTIVARPAFIILTQSQRAQTALFGMTPDGTFDRLERELAASKRFAVIYLDGGARVYRMLEPAGPPRPPA